MNHSVHRYFVSLTETFIWLKVFDIKNTIWPNSFTNIYCLTKTIYNIFLLLIESNLFLLFFLSSRLINSTDSNLFSSKRNRPSGVYEEPHSEDREGGEKTGDWVSAVHQGSFIIVSFLLDIVCLSFCPEEVCENHHEEAVNKEDLVDGADHLDHYHLCLRLLGEGHFAMLSEVAVIRWIVSGYLTDWNKRRVSSNENLMDVYYTSMIYIYLAVWEVGWWCSSKTIKVYCKGTKQEVITNLFPAQMVMVVLAIWTLFKSSRCDIGCRGCLYLI